MPSPQGQSMLRDEPSRNTQVFKSSVLLPSVTSSKGASAHKPKTAEHITTAPTCKDIVGNSSSRITRECLPPWPSLSPSLCTQTLGNQGCLTMDQDNKPVCISGSQRGVWDVPRFLPLVPVKERVQREKGASLKMKPGHKLLHLLRTSTGLLRPGRSQAFPTTAVSGLCLMLSHPSSTLRLHLR